MSNQKAQEAYLRETKQMMRSKLRELGATLTITTPFRAYVDGIDEAVSKQVTAATAEVRERVRNTLSTTGREGLVFELTAEDFVDVYYVRRYALYNHSFLTSVELHPSIVSVEANAFYGCTKLETVVLTKGVKLQSNCFANCTALKQVYLPTITDASERPVLNADTVFPNFESAPNCKFIVSDYDTLNLYNADTRWKAVLLGRSALIEGMTES